MTKAKKTAATTAKASKTAAVTTLPVATETKAISYTDMIAAVSDDARDTMLAAINTAFDDRATYEISKSADGTLGKAFLGARKVMTGNVQVAKLLCAFNVNADDVINKSRKSNARANLYALHKLASIARYAAGETAALDKVSIAFLSSAIVFQREAGADALLSTDAQESALSRAATYRNLAQHVIDALTDQATRANMKGGKATQASQCRTMLENIGALDRVDNSHIRVKLNHALLARIAERMVIAL